MVMIYPILNLCIIYNNNFTYLAIKIETNEYAGLIFRFLLEKCKYELNLLVKTDDMIYY